MVGKLVILPATRWAGDSVVNGGRWKQQLTSWLSSPVLCPLLVQVCMHTVSERATPIKDLAIVLELCSILKPWYYM